MNHKLKIEENYLKNLLNGKKKAEVRFNDRDYQVGDTLQFHNTEASVGDDDFYVYYKITHIHSGLGIEKGYVVLSVERMGKEAE